MKFLKKGSLALINGGYLTIGADETPVTNVEFVNAQKEAELLCKIAEAVKGKNFKDIKGENLEALIAKVISEVNLKNRSDIFKTPEKPLRELGDKIAAEALAFIQYDDNVSKANELNNRFQQYAIIKEFEDFGLFFTDGIVKLNHIYSVDDIKAALEIMYDVYYKK